MMTRQTLASSKLVAPHSHYKHCHAAHRKCSMQKEKSELLREITVLLRKNRPLRDPSTHSLTYTQNIILDQTRGDSITSSSSSVSSFSNKECQREAFSGHSFDAILMGAASFDLTSDQDPVPCMDHRKDSTSINSGGKQREEMNVNINNDNINKNNGCSSCLAVAPPAQIRHHPKRNVVRLRKTKACKNTRQPQPNNEAIEYKERVINPINADSVGQQTESIRSAPYSATHKEEEEEEKEEELVRSFNKQDKSESRCAIVQWKHSTINHRRGKSLNPEVGLGKFSMPRTAYSSSPVETTSEYMGTTSFHSDTESHPLLFESTADSQDTSELGMERFQSARSHRRRVTNRGASASSPLKGRHLSFSEKYMPQSFDEIVGQSFVIQALKNALRTGKIAPLYIFYGPRGTGKTSCARLLAMSLTCLSVMERDPCGSCVECVAHLLGETSILNRVGKHNIRRANNYLKALLQDTSTATTKSLSSSSYYKAFILDECHSLSAQAWSAYIELLEDAPTNAVFILSASSLEQLPPVIISRSQKFFFAKMKENEIVRKLKVVAAKEHLEIEPEALKLIVASSNGSLQDAETTLEQLSLLGPKISATMVQELIGLVPEEQLVELLHFALSRDYSSTVKSLKELTEAGVEPVALISQLASLVTQILTRGYEAPKERNGCHLLTKDLRDVSKEETETLRRALKTLSEAEKQLRSSSDPWTWLTAALLQFASDQPHIQSSSYQDKGKHNKSSPYLETSDATSRNQSKGPRSELIAANDPLSLSYSKIRSCDRAAPRMQTDGKVNELEDIWQNTLDSMCSNNLRQLLSSHGRLVSLSFCKAFTVATIGFSQEEHRSHAEKLSTAIACAFQSTLGRLVEVRVTLYDTSDERIREEDFMIPLKNNEGDEAEGNPWTQKGESVPYGSMRRTYGIQNRNRSDDGKKLHLDAAWNIHDQEQDIAQDFVRDQNCHQASAESTCKLDKAYRNPCKAKALAKRSSKGGRFNFRFLHSHQSEGIIREEDIDGPELHVANIHKADHMNIKAMTLGSSPDFSAAEESSGVAGFLCWKRTRGHRKEKVTWCERGPGILMGLVPCPKYT